MIEKNLAPGQPHFRIQQSDMEVFPRKNFGELKVDVDVRVSRAVSTWMSRVAPDSHRGLTFWPSPIDHNSLSSILKKLITAQSAPSSESPQTQKLTSTIYSHSLQKNYYHSL